MRIALIDSCGSAPGARGATAFADDGRAVRRVSPVDDPTGHGSMIARLLTAATEPVDLLLAQVFVGPGPTTGATVAAAIDWAVGEGVWLIHLSLGLAADRSPLAAAVERAVAADILIVAASPARGRAVYPAAYPGVIRATGDARCMPEHWSMLEPGLFGGCPSFAGSRRGASVGAAWITRTVRRLAGGQGFNAATEALTTGATYRGREHLSSERF